MMSREGYRQMNRFRPMTFEQWLKKNYDMRLCEFYDLDKTTQAKIRDKEYENYKK